MKKAFGCIVIVILLIIGLFFALHLGIAIWAQLHIEGPAEPEIKYAEFPFTLTYEINGEQITVEDVYVCELEYCGFDINAGQQRIWKGYIKSTEERNLTVVEFKEGSYQCRIFCSLGSPKVYMGDSENSREIEPSFYIEKETRMGKSTSMIGQEYIDKYGLKIISFDSAPPIENTFK